MIPLFTNFAALFTLDSKQEKSNNAQSIKQNTSMKSKLCCKNSMLREFICRLRSESKKFFALFTFEKFMSLFSSSPPASLCASWHEISPLRSLLHNGQVYMIHDEMLMQSVWIGFTAFRVWNRKCIWHPTRIFDDLNSCKINANSRWPL